MGFNIVESPAEETFSRNADHQYFFLKYGRIPFKCKRVQQDDFTKQIKVQLIGEPAVDHQESFFGLLNTLPQSELIGNGTFRHNIASLDNNEF